jgi:hypothetical protein
MIGMFVTVAFVFVAAIAFSVWSQAEEANC